MLPFVPQVVLEALVRDPFDTAAIAPQLRAAGTPTLVLHGTEDEIVPFWHGEAVATLLGLSAASGSFLPLEGAGHNNVFTRRHAAPVLDAIERFARVLPREQPRPPGA